MSALPFVIYPRAPAPTGGTTAPAPSTAPPAPVAPKRGGLHPNFGAYVGGASLDDTYHLTEADSYFYASQVRTLKQTALNETTLKGDMIDTSKPKFDGKLQLGISSSTELDKERFISFLKQNVGYYGLETFFYLPDNGAVVNLLDNSHRFSHQEVLNEHVLRMGTTGVFLEYDFYERSDRALSRLMVESCVLARLSRNKV